MAQSYSKCTFHFRFKKNEIHQLKVLLEIPDPTIMPQRYNASAEQLLALIVLLACSRRTKDSKGLFLKSIESLLRFLTLIDHIQLDLSRWRCYVTSVLLFLTSPCQEAQDRGHRDVLPLVQGALNHQPADRLGGIAPVTAFTGLPAKTPLAGFVHPTSKEVYVADWLGA
ncbi:hypothetical protein DYB36_012165, partial [Aphanomyces astaci]